MDSRTRTILLWAGGAILAITGIVILIISFSGGSKDTPSDVEVIYTDAALTLEAQVLTLQAGMLSATPTLGSPTATATLTQLPSPTLGTVPALATSTVASGGATGCDNSVYISDVTIPDGTTVAPGQAFTKTWRVSNTGTCAWTAAYQITFLYGDIMGGKATAIGKVVNPGESADISVALTGPASASGNITGTWRLANANAQAFGTALTVVIKTGAVSPTPTKTATGGAPAATATNTSGAVTPSTNTPTATNTPVTPTVDLTQTSAAQTAASP
jgi:adhesin HecA-like repeat protein